MTSAYLATLGALAAIATVAVIGAAVTFAWWQIRWTRVGWWLHRHTPRPTRHRY